MPRLIYLFQTLPSKISPGFLRDLRSRLARFIWAGKPTRVRRDILTLRKERGGVGFPDPVGYYEASHLARVVDWCVLQKDKPLIHMEQATITIPLEGIVWLSDVEIPQAVRRHPTVGATLRSIKKIFKKTEISTYPSPMIPILGTPSFEPGLTDQGFKDLRRRGTSRLIHFSTDNHVMTSGEIERVFSGDLNLFRRSQINAFLQSITLRMSAVRTPSKFEQICLKGEPLRHSLIYVCPVD